MATKKTVKEEASAEVRTRVYEVGYHVLPTVEGSGIEKVVGAVRESISRAGGVLIAEGAPQEMKLAYTMFINKEGKNYPYGMAHFGWIKFELGSDSVAGIEAALKAHPDILRSIVFKTVREDTRATVRAGMLREVRRGDTLKTPAKRAEDGPKEEVSEEKLDEALGDIVDTK